MAHFFSAIIPSLTSAISASYTYVADTISSSTDAASKRIILHFLDKAVGKFLLTPLTPEQIELLWGNNHLVLKNLVLNVDYIQSEILLGTILPFRLKFAQIGEISLGVNLTNILSLTEDFSKIMVNNVNVLLDLSSNYQSVLDISQNELNAMFDTILQRFKTELKNAFDDHKQIRFENGLNTKTPLQHSSSNADDSVHDAISHDASPSLLASQNGTPRLNETQTDSKRLDIQSSLSQPPISEKYDSGSLVIAQLIEKIALHASVEINDIVFRINVPVVNKNTQQFYYNLKKSQKFPNIDDTTAHTASTPKITTDISFYNENSKEIDLLSYFDEYYTKSSYHIARRANYRQIYREKIMSMKSGSKTSKNPTSSQQPLEKQNPAHIDVSSSKDLKTALYTELYTTTNPFAQNEMNNVVDHKSIVSSNNADVIEHTPSQYEYDDCIIDTIAIALHISSISARDSNTLAAESPLNTKTTPHYQQQQQKHDNIKQTTGPSLAWKRSVAIGAISFSLGQLNQNARICSSQEILSYYTHKIKTITTTNKSASLPPLFTENIGSSVMKKLLQGLDVLLLVGEPQKTSQPHSSTQPTTHFSSKYTTFIHFTCLLPHKERDMALFSAKQINISSSSTQNMTDFLHHLRTNNHNKNETSNIMGQTISFAPTLLQQDNDIPLFPTAPISHDTPHLSLSGFHYHPNSLFTSSSLTSHHNSFPLAQQDSLCDNNAIENDHQTNQSDITSPTLASHQHTTKVTNNAQFSLLSQMASLSQQCNNTSPLQYGSVHYITPYISFQVDIAKISIFTKPSHFTMMLYSIGIITTLADQTTALLKHLPLIKHVLIPNKNDHDADYDNRYGQDDNHTEVKLDNTFNATFNERTIIHDIALRYAMEELRADVAFEGDHMLTPTTSTTTFDKADDHYDINSRLEPSSNTIDDNIMGDYDAILDEMYNELYGLTAPHQEQHSPYITSTTSNNNNSSSHTLNASSVLVTRFTSPNLLKTEKLPDINQHPPFFYQIRLFFRDFINITLKIDKINVCVLLNDVTPVHALSRCVRDPSNCSYNINNDIIIPAASLRETSNKDQTVDMVTKKHQNNSCTCFDCTVYDQSQRIIHATYNSMMTMKQNQQNLRGTQPSHGDVTDNDDNNNFRNDSDSRIHLQSHDLISPIPPTSHHGSLDRSMISPTTTPHELQNALRARKQLTLSYKTLYKIARNNLNNSPQSLNNHMFYHDIAYNLEKEDDNQFNDDGNGTTDTNKNDNYHHNDNEIFCDCLYCCTKFQYGPLYPHSFAWWEYDIFSSIDIPSYVSQNDSNAISLPFTAPTMIQRDLKKTEIKRDKHSGDNGNFTGDDGGDNLKNNLSHDLFPSSIFPTNHLFISLSHIYVRATTASHGLKINIAMQDFVVYEGLRVHFLKVKQPLEKILILPSQAHQQQNSHIKSKLNQQQSTSSRVLTKAMIYKYITILSIKSSSPTLLSHHEQKQSLQSHHSDPFPIYLPNSPPQHPLNTSEHHTQFHYQPAFTLEVTLLEKDFYDHHYGLPLRDFILTHHGREGVQTNLCPDNPKMSSSPLSFTTTTTSLPPAPFIPLKSVLFGVAMQHQTHLRSPMQILLQAEQREAEYVLKNLFLLQQNHSNDDNNSINQHLPINPLTSFTSQIDIDSHYHSYASLLTRYLPKRQQPDHSHTITPPMTNTVSAPPHQQFYNHYSHSFSNIQVSEFIDNLLENPLVRHQLLPTIPISSSLTASTIVSSPLSPLHSPTNSQHLNFLPTTSLPIPLYSLSYSDDISSHISDLYIGKHFNFHQNNDNWPTSPKNPKNWLRLCHQNRYQQYCPPHSPDLSPNDEDYNHQTFLNHEINDDPSDDYHNEHDHVHLSNITLNFPHLIHHSYTLVPIGILPLLAPNNSNISTQSPTSTASSPSAQNAVITTSTYSLKSYLNQPSQEDITLSSHQSQKQQCKKHLFYDEISNIDGFVPLQQRIVISTAPIFVNFDVLFVQRIDALLSALNDCDISIYIPAAQKLCGRILNNYLDLKMSRDLQEDSTTNISSGTNNLPVSSTTTTGVTLPPFYTLTLHEHLLLQLESLKMLLPQFSDTLGKTIPDSDSKPNHNIDMHSDRMNPSSTILNQNTLISESISIIDGKIKRITRPYRDNNHQNIGSKLPPLMASTHTSRQKQDLSTPTQQQSSQTTSSSSSSSSSLPIPEQPPNTLRLTQIKLPPRAQIIILLPEINLTLSTASPQQQNATIAPSQSLFAGLQQQHLQQQLQPQRSHIPQHAYAMIDARGPQLTTSLALTLKNTFFSVDTAHSLFDLVNTHNQSSISDDSDLAEAYSLCAPKVPLPKQHKNNALLESEHTIGGNDDDDDDDNEDCAICGYGLNQCPKIPLKCLIISKIALFESQREKLAQKFLHDVQKLSTTNQQNQFSSISVIKRMSGTQHYHSLSDASQYQSSSLNASKVKKTATQTNLLSHLDDTFYDKSEYITEQEASTIHNTSHLPHHGDHYPNRRQKQNNLKRKLSSFLYKYETIPVSSLTITETTSIPSKSSHGHIHGKRSTRNVKNVQKSTIFTAKPRWFSSFLPMRHISDTANFGKTDIPTNITDFNNNSHNDEKVYAYPPIDEQLYHSLLSTLQPTNSISLSFEHVEVALLYPVELAQTHSQLPQQFLLQKLKKVGRSKKKDDVICSEKDGKLHYYSSNDNVVQKALRSLQYETANNCPINSQTTIKLVKKTLLQCNFMPVSLLSLLDTFNIKYLVGKHLSMPQFQRENLNSHDTTRNSNNQNNTLFFGSVSLNSVYPIGSVLLHITSGVKIPQLSLPSMFYTDPNIPHFTIPSSSLDITSDTTTTSPLDNLAHSAPSYTRHDITSRCICDDLSLSYPHLTIVLPQSDTAIEIRNKASVNSIIQQQSAFFRAFESNSEYNTQYNKAIEAIANDIPIVSIPQTAVNEFTREKDLFSGTYIDNPVLSALLQSVSHSSMRQTLFMHKYGVKSTSTTSSLNPPKASSIINKYHKSNATNSIHDDYDNDSLSIDNTFEKTHEMSSKTIMSCSDLGPTCNDSIRKYDVPTNPQQQQTSQSAPNVQSLPNSSLRALSSVPLSAIFESFLQLHAKINLFVELTQVFADIGNHELAILMNFGDFLGANVLENNLNIPYLSSKLPVSYLSQHIRKKHTPNPHFITTSVDYTNIFLGNVVSGWVTGVPSRYGERDFFPSFGGCQDQCLLYDFKHANKLHSYFFPNKASPARSSCSVYQTLTKPSSISPDHNDQTENNPKIQTYDMTPTLDLFLSHNDPIDGEGVKRSKQTHHLSDEIPSSYLLSLMKEKGIISHLTAKLTNNHHKFEPSDDDNDNTPKDIFQSAPREMLLFIASQDALEHYELDLTDLSSTIPSQFSQMMRIPSIATFFNSRVPSESSSGETTMTIPSGDNFLFFYYLHTKNILHTTTLLSKHVSLLSDLFHKAMLSQHSDKIWLRSLLLDDLKQNIQFYDQTPLENQSNMIKSIKFDCYIVPQPLSPPSSLCSNSSQQSSPPRLRYVSLSSLIPHPLNHISINNPLLSSIPHRDEIIGFYNPVYIAQHLCHYFEIKFHIITFKSVINGEITDLLSSYGFISHKYSAFHSTISTIVQHLIHTGDHNSSPFPQNSPEMPIFDHASSKIVDFSTINPVSYDPMMCYAIMALFTVHTRALCGERVTKTDDLSSIDNYHDDLDPFKLSPYQHPLIKESMPFSFFPPLFQHYHHNNNSIDLEIQIQQIEQIQEMKRVSCIFQYFDVLYRLFIDNECCCYASFDNYSEIVNNGLCCCNNQQHHVDNNNIVVKSHSVTPCTSNMIDFIPCNPSSFYETAKELLNSLSMISSTIPSPQHSSKLTYFADNCDNCSDSDEFLEFDDPLFKSQSHYNDALSIEDNHLFSTSVFYNDQSSPIIDDDDDDNHDPDTDDDNEVEEWADSTNGPSFATVLDYPIPIISTFEQQQQYGKESQAKTKGSQIVTFDDDVLNDDDPADCDLPSIYHHYNDYGQLLSSHYLIFHEKQPKYKEKSGCGQIRERYDEVIVFHRDPFPTTTTPIPSSPTVLCACPQQYSSSPTLYHANLPVNASLLTILLSISLLESQHSTESDDTMTVNTGSIVENQDDTVPSSTTWSNSDHNHGSLAPSYYYHHHHHHPSTRKMNTDKYNTNDSLSIRAIPNVFSLTSVPKQKVRDIYRAIISSLIPASPFLCNLSLSIYIHSVLLAVHPTLPPPDHIPSAEEISTKLIENIVKNAENDTSPKIGDEQLNTILMQQKNDLLIHSTLEPSFLSLYKLRQAQSSINAKILSANRSSHFSAVRTERIGHNNNMTKKIDDVMINAHFHGSDENNLNNLYSSQSRSINPQPPQTQSFSDNNYNPHLSLHQQQEQPTQHNRKDVLHSLANAAVYLPYHPITNRSIVIDSRCISITLHKNITPTCSAVNNNIMDNPLIHMTPSDFISYFRRQLYSTTPTATKDSPATFTEKNSDPHIVCITHEDKTIARWLSHSLSQLLNTTSYSSNNIRVSVSLHDIIIRQYSMNLYGQVLDDYLQNIDLSMDSLLSYTEKNGLSSRNSQYYPHQRSMSKYFKKYKIQQYTTHLSGGVNQSIPSFLKTVPYAAKIQQEYNNNKNNIDCHQSGLEKYDKMAKNDLYTPLYSLDCVKFAYVLDIPVVNYALLLFAPSLPVTYKLVGNSSPQHSQNLEKVGMMRYNGPLPPKSPLKTVPTNFGKFLYNYHNLTENEMIHPNAPGNFGENDILPHNAVYPSMVDDTQPSQHKHGAVSTDQNGIINNIVLSTLINCSYSIKTQIDNNILNLTLIQYQKPIPVVLSVPQMPHLSFKHSHTLSSSLPRTELCPTTLSNDIVEVDLNINNATVTFEPNNMWVIGLIDVLFAAIHNKGVLNNHIHSTSLQSGMLLYENYYYDAIQTLIDSLCDDDDKVSAQTEKDTLDKRNIFETSQIGIHSSFCIDNFSSTPDDQMKSENLSSYQINPSLPMKRRKLNLDLSSLKPQYNDLAMLQQQQQHQLHHRKFDLMTQTKQSTFHPTQSNPHAHQQPAMSYNHLRTTHHTTTLPNPVDLLPIWFKNPSTTRITIHTTNCIVDYNPIPADTTHNLASKLSEFTEMARDHLNNASIPIAGESLGPSTASAARPNSNQTTPTDILSSSQTATPPRESSIPADWLKFNLRPFTNYSRSPGRIILAVPLLSASILACNYAPLAVTVFASQPSIFLLDHSLKASHMPIITLSSLEDGGVAWGSPDYSSTYDIDQDSWQFIKKMKVPTLGNLKTSQSHQNKDDFGSTREKTDYSHTIKRDPILSHLDDKTINRIVSSGGVSQFVHNNVLLPFHLNHTRSIDDIFVRDHQSSAIIATHPPVNEITTLRQTPTTRFSMLYNHRRLLYSLPSLQSTPTSKSTSLSASIIRRFEDYDPSYLFYRRLVCPQVSQLPSVSTKFSQHSPQNGLFCSFLTGPFMSQIPANYHLLKQHCIENVASTVYPDTFARFAESDSDNDDDNNYNNGTLFVDNNPENVAKQQKSRKVQRVLKQLGANVGSPRGGGIGININQFLYDHGYVKLLTVTQLTISVDNIIPFNFSEINKIQKSHTPQQNSLLSPNSSPNNDITVENTGISTFINNIANNFVAKYVNLDYTRCSNTLSEGTKNTINNDHINTFPQLPLHPTLANVPDKSHSFNKTPHQYTVLVQNPYCALDPTPLPNNVQTLLSKLYHNVDFPNFSQFSSVSSLDSEARFDAMFSKKNTGKSTKNNDKTDAMRNIALNNVKFVHDLGVEFSELDKFRDHQYRSTFFSYTPYKWLNVRDTMNIIHGEFLYSANVHDYDQICQNIPSTNPTTPLPTSLIMPTPPEHCNYTPFLLSTLQSPSITPIQYLANPATIPHPSPHKSLKNSEQIQVMIDISTVAAECCIDSLLIFHKIVTVLVDQFVTPIYVQEGGEPSMVDYHEVVELSNNDYFTDFLASQNDLQSYQFDQYTPRDFNFVDLSFENSAQYVVQQNNGMMYHKYSQSPYLNQSINPYATGILAPMSLPSSIFAPLSFNNHDDNDDETNHDGHDFSLNHDNKKNNAPQSVTVVVRGGDSSTQPQPSRPHLQLPQHPPPNLTTPYFGPEGSSVTQRYHYNYPTQFNRYIHSDAPVFGQFHNTFNKFSKFQQSTHHHDHHHHSATQQPLPSLLIPNHVIDVDYNPNNTNTNDLEHSNGGNVHIQPLSFPSHDRSHGGSNMHLGSYHMQYSSPSYDPLTMSQLTYAHTSQSSTWGDGDIDGGLNRAPMFTINIDTIIDNYISPPESHHHESRRGHDINNNAPTSTSLFTLSRNNTDIREIQQDDDADEECVVISNSDQQSNGKPHTLSFTSKFSAEIGEECNLNDGTIDRYASIIHHIAPVVIRDHQTTFSAKTHHLPQQSRITQINTSTTTTPRNTPTVINEDADAIQIISNHDYFLNNRQSRSKQSLFSHKQHLSNQRQSQLPSYSVQATIPHIEPHTPSQQHHTTTIMLTPQMQRPLPPCSETATSLSFSNTGRTANTTAMNRPNMPPPPPPPVASSQKVNIISDLQRVSIPENSSWYIIREYFPSVYPHNCPLLTNMLELQPTIGFSTPNLSVTLPSVLSSHPTRFQELDTHHSTMIGSDIQQHSREYYHPPVKVQVNLFIGEISLSLYRGNDCLVKQSIAQHKPLHHHHNNNDSASSSTALLHTQRYHHTFQQQQKLFGEHPVFIDWTSIFAIPQFDSPTRVLYPQNVLKLSFPQFSSSNSSSLSSPPNSCDFLSKLPKNQPLSPYHYYSFALLPVRDHSDPFVAKFNRLWVELDEFWRATMLWWLPVQAFRESKLLEMNIGSFGLNFTTFHSHNRDDFLDDDIINDDSVKQDRSSPQNPISSTLLLNQMEHVASSVSIVLDTLTIFDCVESSPFKHILTILPSKPSNWVDEEQKNETPSPKSTISTQVASPVNIQSSVPNPNSVFSKNNAALDSVDQNENTLGPSSSTRTTPESNLSSRMISLRLKPLRQQSSSLLINLTTIRNPYSSSFTHIESTVATQSQRKLEKKNATNSMGSEYLNLYVSLNKTVKVNLHQSTEEVLLATLFHSCAGHHHIPFLSSTHSDHFPDELIHKSKTFITTQTTDLLEDCTLSNRFAAFLAAVTTINTTSSYDQLNASSNLLNDTTNYTNVNIKSTPLHQDFRLINPFSTENKNMTVFAFIKELQLDIEAKSNNNSSSTTTFDTVNNQNNHKLIDPQLTALFTTVKNVREYQQAIKSCYISPLSLVIDYQPYGASLSGLKDKQFFELLHLFTIKSLAIHLPAIIIPLATDVLSNQTQQHEQPPQQQIALPNGFIDLFTTIISTYSSMECVSAQFLALLVSLTPTTPFTDIVQGVGDVVLQPLSYGDGAVNGLKRITKGGLGAIKLLLDMSSTLLTSATQGLSNISSHNTNIPPNGSGSINPNNTPTTLVITTHTGEKQVIHVKNNATSTQQSSHLQTYYDQQQPQSMQDAMKRSWDVLSASLQSTMFTIITPPSIQGSSLPPYSQMSTQQQRSFTSGSNGLVNVAIAVPQLVINPVNGLIKASAVLIGGLMSPLDQEHDQELSPVLKE